MPAMNTPKSTPAVTPNESRRVPLRDVNAPIAPKELKRQVSQFRELREAVRAQKEVTNDLLNREVSI